MWYVTSCKFSENNYGFFIYYYYILYLLYIILLPWTLAGIMQKPQRFSENSPSLFAEKHFISNLQSDTCHQRRLNPYLRIWTWDLIFGDVKNSKETLYRFMVFILEISIKWNSKCPGWRQKITPKIRFLDLCLNLAGSR